METYDDFLFAHPSFIEGIARLFDFGNTLNEYNVSETPDNLAIHNDWVLVGNDLKKAMKTLDKELQNSKP